MFNNHTAHWSKTKAKAKSASLTILLERSHHNYVITPKLRVGGVKNDISDNVRDAGVQKEINSWKRERYVMSVPDVVTTDSKPG